MKRTGGCACGAVRFEVTAPFIAMGACHCRDCQRSSGGGPNYVVLVPRDALVVIRGEARLYLSRGDSGGEIGRAFCPDCGTPLWSVPAYEPFLTVKVGALDDASDFAPAAHVYANSAPGWHPMTPGAARFPKMPPAP